MPLLKNENKTKEDVSSDGQVTKQLSEGEWGTCKQWLQVTAHGVWKQTSELEPHNGSLWG